MSAIVRTPRPKDWQVLATGEDGEAMTGPGPIGRQLRVIWSEAPDDLGRVWRHVSINAMSAKLPTWGEMEWARQMFIGNIETYQVHPPEDRYVNAHEGVLHLWACVDEPNGLLPDFAALQWV